MAKEKTEKTNVMRLLEQKGIPYTPHDYRASGAVGGTEVAAALDEDPARVFKTLVTQGASGGHYVFVIPVAGERDLKKAAKAEQERMYVSAGKVGCQGEVAPADLQKMLPMRLADVIK